MCGIIGYIGNKDAKKIIIDGLTKLEYRGYDSAGFAFYNVKKDLFFIMKDAIRLEGLVKQLDFDLESNLSIGHTRWASHGVVNKINAHPHQSQSKRFILVHNGVIKNYLKLKEQFFPNHIFKSQTDTEVICELIDLFSKDLSVEQAILKTLNILEGSYALLILDTTNPNVLYAAKNKSPLLIGKDQNGFTIASDVIALVDYSDEYYRLEDESFVIFEKNSVELYDLQFQKKALNFQIIPLEKTNTDKGLYEHYMLKEIHEQPTVIRKLISNYFTKNQINIDSKILNEIKMADRIYILGSGTSLHAGYVGQKYFTNLLNKPTQVHIASEFAYEMPLFSEKPFFILVSQSGETADLRLCAHKLKKNNYKMLTISNVSTSTLAIESDYFLNVFAGPEIAVASTKAYTAQLVVLLLLAAAVANKNNETLKNNLTKVSYAISEFLEEENIKPLVNNILTKNNAFIIGRGFDFCTALEGSLKLKETAYIQSEGYPAGELKHGSIALVEKDTPVIALVSDKRVSNITRNNLNEIVSRGAKSLIISIESVSLQSDHIILNDVDELVKPLLMIVPLQLIAYYTAYFRKLDIDKPRNLVKSVTVE